MAAGSDGQRKEARECNYAVSHLAQLDHGVRAGLVPALPVGMAD
jgi:hypothetical protein